MRPFHFPPIFPACAVVLATLCFACPLHAQQTPTAPVLSLVSIGVTKHSDPTYDLRFPAKDATAIAAFFQAQQGKMFSRVVVKTVTDAKATRRGIIETLVALRKQAPQMGANDYTLIYLTGHGTNDDLDQYFFAPYDVDADSIDATAIDGAMFSRTLDRLPGHVLLLIDTVHAGNIAPSSKAVIFASCGKGELSQESVDWDGGAFARAVLEGLGGAADENHDGTVTLTELASYTTKRVSAMTKQAQNPVLVRPSSVPADLPLAAVAPTH